MSLARKVTTKGLESLKRKLEALPTEAKKDLHQVLLEAALRIQADARRSIQKSPANPDTGRSIPGNPPKTDTGALVNSIFVNAKDNSKDSLTIKVGTNLVYGKYLEFGTVTILARPWLMPAIEYGRPATEKKIRTQIKQAFRKVARMKF